MHQKRTVAILILTFLSHLVSAEKILGIFMGLGRDHYVLGKSFMMNLVETGHDCVLISRYCDEKNNAPRYKEIIVRDDENSGEYMTILAEENQLQIDIFIQGTNSF